MILGFPEVDEEFQRFRLQDYKGVMLRNLRAPRHEELLLSYMFYGPTYAVILGHVGLYKVV